MSDTIAKLRELLLNSSNAGRLRSLLNPEQQQSSPTWNGMLGGLAGAPSELPYKSVEMTPERIRSGLSGLVDMTPVVGDIKSGIEGVQAAREGDWAGAGLGMLGALPFVPGITAWHGSPHKFDKFSLDKIGTGEGAQAYGHGVYLAENPAVATEYSKMNRELDALYSQRGSLRASRKQVPPELDSAIQKAEASTQGNLYKTDIPDEAVARFLDWDKPLSQQAPEVLAKARTAIDSVQGKGFYDEYAKGGADLRDLLYNLDEVPAGGFENLFKEQGIHGIRYLDGGSSATGKGSSNFVVFDDQLPRILERNGQPTGLPPWGKGEWKPK